MAHALSHGNQTVSRFVCGPLNEGIGKVKLTDSLPCMRNDDNRFSLAPFLSCRFGRSWNKLRKGFWRLC